MKRRGKQFALECYSQGPDRASGIFLEKRILGWKEAWLLRRGSTEILALGEG